MTNDETTLLQAYKVWKEYKGWVLCWLTVNISENKFFSPLINVECTKNQHTIVIYICARTHHAHTLTYLP